MNQTEYTKKNVVEAYIDAKGNVIVGDGNTIINLKEASQYKSIETEIEELNQRFKITLERIQKFPDDEEFNNELQTIVEKQKQKQDELSKLKEEVIKLANTFANIPINTDRLRQAQKYFNAGEFKEARAILDVKQMDYELDSTIAKEQLGKKMLERALKERKSLSNEFLILARLTAINFELNNRFEKTAAFVMTPPLRNGHNPALSVNLLSAQMKGAGGSKSE